MPMVMIFLDGYLENNSKQTLYLHSSIARVAELVDALDSKSSVSNNVPVRPRPRVLKPTRFLVGFFFNQKSPFTAHSLSLKIEIVLDLYRLCMFYVYILYSSKYDRYYIGQTNDLKQRVLRLNSCYV